MPPRGPPESRPSSVPGSSVGSRWARAPLRSRSLDFVALVWIIYWNAVSSLSECAAVLAIYTVGWALGRVDAARRHWAPGRTFRSENSRFGGLLRARIVPDTAVYGIFGTVRLSERWMTRSRTTIDWSCMIDGIDRIFVLCDRRYRSFGFADRLWNTLRMTEDARIFSETGK